MCRIRLFCALTLLISLELAAFKAPDALALPKFQIDPERDLEIIQSLQIWNTTLLSPDPLVGSRNDTQLRRGRLGVQGHFARDLGFRVVFAYDGLGRDGLDGLAGSGQSTDNRTFGLLDGFVTWQIAQPWLNLSAGYFRPQVGRENISSAFEVNSFDNLLTSSYLRAHLVGRSNGRETGLSLGGLYQAGGWGLNYSMGMFDTNQERITGGKGDAQNGSHWWSPLLTGRVVLNLGDPEQTSYRMTGGTQAWGRRNGLSLGLNGAWENGSDQFRHNGMAGMDVLWNVGNWSLDGEYDLLMRQSWNQTLMLDQIMHLRAGYAFALPNGQFLEPVAAVGLARVSKDSQLGLPSEFQADLGLNWYLSENRWKISLHWLNRQPEAQYNDGIIALGSQWIL